MCTQHAKRLLTLRAALAVLLVSIAMLLAPSTVRADPCTDKGQIYTGLNGKPGTEVVFRDAKTGKELTRGKLGADGSAVFIYGEPFVPYQVQVFQVQGGKEIPTSININITCRPYGTQGQQNPGSSASVGNSAGNSGTVGDPISTSLGEYAFQMPLLNLGGPLPLYFTLDYASAMNKTIAYDWSFDDLFGGDHLTHNFHIALVQIDDTHLRIFLPYANMIDFEKANEWQVKDEEIPYQLRENDKRFFLLDPRAERIYTFDKRRVVSAKGFLRLGRFTRVEDRNGNAHTLTYDKDSIRIEDGLGRALVLTIADPNEKWLWAHLTQITDQSGRTIKFGYQTNMEGVWTTHLTRVTDALGATTIFNYTGPLTNSVIASVTYPRGNTPYTQEYTQSPTGLWRVASQTDALGNTTQLSFGEGNVTTVTDPLGNTNQDTHKDGMRYSALKDAAGKTATFGYDDAGRRTTITDRMGDTIKMTYHAPTGKVASLTNARGETLTFTYTPQEQAIGPDKIPFTFYNLTRVDYADKSNEQFTYDAKGNVITRLDRAGQTWKYTYNARGQMLTVTNPTGGIVTYTYNDDATLASAKDSETGETRYAYDNLKRVNKITRADNSTIQIAYDANDRIIALTDANNRTTKFEYDANGNVVKVIDAAGKETLYTYDAMDRVSKITNRVGQISDLTYDALGRVASFTDATGITTQYAYDPRGWLNQITRADATWKIGYDDEGVATTLTTPLGNVTQFEHDKLGMLIGVTDPLGHKTTLTRDALSRITRITDPLNRTTNFAYTNDGRLASVTMPVIGAAKYAYNALGNLAKITDLNGAEWKFAYTPQGRLTAQTDPVGQIVNLTYDARGRLNQIVFADSSTSTLTYDASSNLTRSQFSDGLDLKFAYDALHRPIEADGVKFAYDVEGRIVNTDNAGAAYGATYDAAGRIKTITYAGGLVVNYTYDAKSGLLTQVSDSLTKTQYDFTYDKDRQLVGITRSNKVNTTLTWDKAGRLTGIKEGNVMDAQYTLDAAGQVTSAKMQLPLDPAAALKPATQALTFDAASQVSSVGYKYDARGRLVESPLGAFNWDGASRLVGIQSTVASQPSSVALTYNGLGDVTARQDGNQTTRYVYNYALGLAPIVAETDPSTPGKPLRYYVWAPSGQLLYMIDAADGNQVYHYHFDRTGSTLALTDASGAVTDAYAYDPYGKLLAHQGKSAQPFTFVGKWGVRQEGASGALYQMRARYYDATTARFISREPLWTPVGDARKINPYQYALNAPSMMVDVTGSDPRATAYQRQGVAIAQWKNIKARLQEIAKAHPHLQKEIERFLGRGQPEELSVQNDPAASGEAIPDTMLFAISSGKLSVARQVAFQTGHGLYKEFIDDLNELGPYASFVLGWEMFVEEARDFLARMEAQRVNPYVQEHILWLAEQRAARLLYGNREMARKEAKGLWVHRYGKWLFFGKDAQMLYRESSRILIYVADADQPIWLHDVSEVWEE